MILRNAIWPCIKDSTEHLRRYRDAGAPTEVVPGLNFSIILGSACLLEGVLEASLRALLELRRSTYSTLEIPDFETRRSMNTYYSRLEEDLDARIGRSLGAAGYDDLFMLVAGERLSQMKHVAPCWESITTLFNFRNVLGHGRQISARRRAARTEYPDEGGFHVLSWIDEFSGSYRVVESYLKKRKLLSSSFVDGSAPYLYLTNAVADHFLDVALGVAKTISESLTGAEKLAHDAAFAWPPEGKSA